jgi:hypothetical protein
MWPAGASTAGQHVLNLVEHALFDQGFVSEFF